MHIRNEMDKLVDRHIKILTNRRKYRKEYTQTGKEMDKLSEKQIKRYTNTQIDRSQTDFWTQNDTNTMIQIDRRTNRQTHRQTNADKQMDRQRDVQFETHTEKYIQRDIEVN